MSAQRIILNGTDAGIARVVETDAEDWPITRALR